MNAELKSNPFTQDNIIGKRLKREREAKELSQMALAKKADISRSAIVHYETGKVIPGGPELIKLADALEITPNFILSGSDEYFHSKKPEHALADYDDVMPYIIRTAFCLMALDRESTEVFSAMLLTMVKQKKTEKEFEKFLKLLDIMASQLAPLSETFDQPIDELVEKMNKEGVFKELED